jgi:hypothetical protein
MRPEFQLVRKHERGWGDGSAREEPSLHLEPHLHLRHLAKWIGCVTPARYAPRTRSSPFRGRGRHSALADIRAFGVGGGVWP